MVQLPRWLSSLSGKLSVWSSFYLLSLACITAAGALLQRVHGGEQGIPPAWVTVLSCYGALAVPTLCITVLLQGIISVHARYNTSLPKARRAVWIALFFLSLGILTLPLYWHRYMRARERDG